MPAQTNLKSMSIDKLMALRDQIELYPRVEGRRGAPQPPVSIGHAFPLQRCCTRGTRAVRGAVAAKYRNPENPSETWAGRGLKPRWLVAAIKAGHKPDDFLIAGGNGATKSASEAAQAQKLPGMVVPHCAAAPSPQNTAIPTTRPKLGQAAD